MYLASLPKRIQNLNLYSDSSPFKINEILVHELQYTMLYRFYSE